MSNTPNPIKLRRHFFEDEPEDTYDVIDRATGTVLGSVRKGYEYAYGADWYARDVNGDRIGTAHSRKDAVSAVVSRSQNA